MNLLKKKKTTQKWKILCLKVIKMGILFHLLSDNNTFMKTPFVHCFIKSKISAKISPRSCRSKTFLFLKEIHKQKKKLLILVHLLNHKFSLVKIFFSCFFLGFLYIFVTLHYVMYVYIQPFFRL